MYGQIHVALQDLVKTMFGEESWEQVLKASKLNETDHFMLFKIYPDAVTMDLIQAASKILELPMDAVLKEFGGHFLKYCLRHGYDKMLTTLGRDVISFIQNLDSLHCLLTFSYPGILSPSFRCTEKDDGTIVLHYYSQRDGLYPIVIGILEAAGKTLFNQTVTVRVTSQDVETLRSGKPIYHIVMELEVADRLNTKKMWALEGGEKMKRIRGMSQFNLSNPGRESIIREEDLSLAFPFHILFDQNLRIQEFGETIEKLSPIPLKSGTPLQELCDIIQPNINPTTENIMKFINNIFLIAIHRKVDEKPFVLRGQMIFLPHCAHLLFVGSPRLQTLQDFQELQVFLCDIPLYDVTRELVLLNQQRIAEINIAHKVEETTIELKKMSKALEEEKKKTETLLLEMLPAKIARQLTSGKMVKGERHKSCTVLFSDVVGFTDIASKCAAEEIINMLNDMYYRFDSSVECHDVYKVETIGDAYMAATGLPDKQVDHAERMADFAMDMIEESNYVISPATGKPIVIRVGMHSGEVIAGVIGKKKPRYDIYGDTVNTASRMESNSLPGCINVSEATFSLLYPMGYKFKARGEIIIKGKGGMKAFFLTGFFDHLLTLPGNELRDLEDLVHPNPTCYVGNHDGCRYHSVTPVKQISFEDSQSPTQSRRFSILSGLLSLGSKIFSRASNMNTVDSKRNTLFVSHLAIKSDSVNEPNLWRCGGDRKRSDKPSTSITVSSTKHQPISEDSGENSKAASFHKDGVPYVETRHGDEVVPLPAKLSDSVTESNPGRCGRDRKRSGMPFISSAMPSTKHQPIIPEDSGENSKAASFHNDGVPFVETRHGDEVSHPNISASRKRTCFVCIVM